MDSSKREVPSNKVEHGRAIMDRLQIELGCDTLIVAFKTDNGSEVMAEGGGQDLITRVATAFLQLGITAVMNASASHVEGRGERSAQ